MLFLISSLLSEHFYWKCMFLITTNVRLSVRWTAVGRSACYYVLLLLEHLSFSRFDEFVYKTTRNIEMMLRRVGNRPIRFIIGMGCVPRIAIVRPSVRLSDSSTYRSSDHFFLRYNIFLRFHLCTCIVVVANFEISNIG